MARVIVITGTNTGVGKTVATASALAATRCVAPHLRLGLMKPAQTGEESVSLECLGWASYGDRGDLAVVRTLLGESPETFQPLAVSEMVRYPEPLAPDMAARRAGMPLYTASSFAAAVDEAARSCDVFFMEGAGGLLVGMGEEPDGRPTTLVEIAQELTQTGAHELSFVLVSQPNLGMLNQCVLSYRELRRAGLDLCGVVFGSWPQDPDLPMLLNAEEVERLTGAPVIGTIPSGVGAIPAVEEGSVLKAGASWWAQLPWIG